ncbi:hypothetical protein B0H14DRAFT_3512795 [Mycena olivaceomarginata]|nr:hypothetical protein B0H14DRAFT_3512795 [Mycena olivaceomarginata]
MQTAIHSATCHWLTGAHWHSGGESTERFWVALTPPTGSTKETSLGKQNDCIAEDSTLSVDTNFMLKRHHHDPVRKALLLQGRRVKTKNAVIYRVPVISSSLISILADLRGLRDTVEIDGDGDEIPPLIVDIIMKTKL